MTRSLSVLATPNDDLAVDRMRRVYKRKPQGWTRLYYHLPKDASMLSGKARAVVVEVVA